MYVALLFSLCLFSKAMNFCIHTSYLSWGKQTWFFTLQLASPRLVHPRAKSHSTDLLLILDERQNPRHLTELGVTIIVACKCGANFTFSLD
jgi:hypothetical protein